MGEGVGGGRLMLHISQGRVMGHRLLVHKKGTHASEEAQVSEAAEERLWRPEQGTIQDPTGNMKVFITSELTLAAA